MEILGDMDHDTPLKKWRSGANLSPQAAADLIGVTLPMWSRWENGRRNVPAERVLDIETKTGVSRHLLRPDVFGADAVGQCPHCGETAGAKSICDHVDCPVLPTSKEAA